MTPDVRINNEIAIHIQKFETLYRKNADGTLSETDVVTYGPMGDPKTVITREIRRISAVLPLEDCGDNIAYLMANKLWGAIEPAYQHWKENNALPESGTPLAAWAGVTAGQAEVLKTAGLKSVEAIADASDIIITKTGLPNALLIREQARKFVAGESTAKENAKVAHLEAQNDELRAQMAELMEQMKLMMSEQVEKKRGRPAKADKIDAEAEAA